VKRISVLIVDDSVVVRRLLTTILDAEADIEVVGTASSAAVALTKIEQTKPAVITLDVEMPGVSGLELLEDIRRSHPRVPIIMFSSLTQHAGATTLEALARGATDYVTKPSGARSRAEAEEQVRRELVPKVRALGARDASRLPAPVATPSRPLPAYRATEGGARPAEILAIGCSTGGPNALGEVFGGLPPSLGVPVVVVQHMPPIFTKLLAERLNALGRLRVREAQEGDALERGLALVAPGGSHLRVVRRGGRAFVALDQGPPVNSCRPAVDNLFDSVASVFENRALAVVMTGMGQDGLRGCERIRANGGQVVVQDEASSVVWGMPGFVAKAGLAHAVLPLRSIAGEILTRVSRRTHLEESLGMEHAHDR